MPKCVTIENVGEDMKLIANSYPELQASFNEAREIMALLSVYGTNEAIEAAPLSTRVMRRALQNLSQ